MEMRELSRQLNADEKAAKLLVDAWEDQHKVGLQTLNVMQGISNMAGRLNNMMTQYNTLQIRINQLEEQRTQAYQRLTQAQEALSIAQNKLTQVVAEYGPESREAAEATREVEKAQRELDKAVKDVTAADEKLAAAQQQTTMMLVNFALQAPAFISQAVKMSEQVMVLATTVANAGGIMGVFHGAVQTVSGALSFLAANPIVLVIAAVAALVAGLVYLYNTNEDVRRTIDGLISILQGAFIAAWNAVSNAIKWFMDNVLMPVYNALKWLWDALNGIANALGLAGEKAQEAGGAAAEAARIGAGVPVVAVPGMIPGAQAGGFVERSGLAVIHRGELVVPAEIVREAPARSIVIEKIEVNIQGVLDRDLLDEIAKGIGRRLRERGVLA